MLLKILIFIWIAIPLYLLPQDVDSITISGNYTIKIDSIKIIGNETTKEYIILRELSFQNGDSLSHSLANYNRDRVYSLGIFTSVDVFPVQYKDYTCAFIAVEESWYIYPIPFAELRDNDWNKISYGIDVQINNFRGRNERIKVRAAFGFDPSYYLLYSNPLINKEQNLFLNSQFYYRKVNNRSKTADSLVHKDFDQRMIGLEAALGKRFSLFETASFVTGFSYVETPFYVTGISASDERIDRVIFAGVGYTYDARDLAQFPKVGMVGSGSIIFKGLGIQGINYQILNTDFRIYREVFKDIFGKVRFASRNTFGNSPYYDYSYLGYGERVRGHSNKVREGLDSYILSMEMFTPIINDFKFSLNWVPIVPRELLTYRLALYIGAFADAGITRGRKEVLSINNTDKGYGLGLTFLILPYNILRLEYAINEFRETEVLVNLGISF